MLQWYSAINRITIFLSLAYTHTRTQCTSEQRRYGKEIGDRHFARLSSISFGDGITLKDGVVITWEVHRTWEESQSWTQATHETTAPQVKATKHPQRGILGPWAWVPITRSSTDSEDLPKHIPGGTYTDGSGAVKLFLIQDLFPLFRVQLYHYYALHIESQD